MAFLTQTQSLKCPSHSHCCYLRNDRHVLGVTFSGQLMFSHHMMITDMLYWMVNWLIMSYLWMGNIRMGKLFQRGGAGQSTLCNQGCNKKPQHVAALNCLPSTIWAGVMEHTLMQSIYSCVGWVYIIVSSLTPCHHPDIIIIVRTQRMITSSVQLQRSVSSDSRFPSIAISELYFTLCRMQPPSLSLFMKKRWCNVAPKW